MIIRSRLFADCDCTKLLHCPWERRAPAVAAMAADQLLAVLAIFRLENMKDDNATQICGIYDISSRKLQIRGVRINGAIDAQHPFFLAMLAVLRLENILDDKVLHVRGIYNATSRELYVSGVRVRGMTEELSEESMQLLCTSAEVEYEDKSTIGHYTYNVQVNKHGLTRMLSSSTPEGSSPDAPVPSLPRLGLQSSGSCFV